MSYGTLEPMDPPETDRRVGFRCRAVHPDVGRCNRKKGHDKWPESDRWHHAMTGADPASGTSGQHWRWKENP